MFLIPFFLFFVQIIIACLFLYFFGYFPWNLILQNFWINYINIFLPIIIIGVTSLSFIVKNPVWALLYILSSFIFLSFLLLNLGIEFITFFFIIVYLGALMMLFLFVIMLFDLQQLNQQNNATKNTKLNFIKFSILYLAAYNVSLLIIQNIEKINLSIIFMLAKYQLSEFNVITVLNTNLLNNYNIFKILYVQNIIYFILITVILLYTLVGALIIVTLITKTKKKS